MEGDSVNRSSALDTSSKAAPAPYSSYASSESFTFFVGPERERFVLPADLVAQLSPNLHALVHNGLKESKEKAVDWGHEDREVFFRFGDFAFKGHYAVPPMPSESQAMDISPLKDDLAAFPTRKKKRNRGRLLPADVSLPTRPISDAEDRKEQNLCETVEKAASTEPYDFGIIHAQVYIFADYHGIEGLKSLSLGHLSDQLRIANMSDRARGGFVELVRYTLNNISDSEKQADPIKTLMITHCVRWYDHLINDADFQELLTPELSVGLLKMIRPANPVMDGVYSPADSLY